MLLLLSILVVLLRGLRVRMHGDRVMCDDLYAMCIFSLSLSETLTASKKTTACVVRPTGYGYL